MKKYPIEMTPAEAQKELKRIEARAIKRQEARGNFGLAEYNKNEWAMINELRAITEESDD
jgi:hypothetical protein